MLIAVATAASCESPQADTRVVRQDTCVYYGEILHGKPHGYGVMLTARGKCLYSGQWKGGRRHGTGTATDSCGRLVRAQWQADTITRGSRTDTAGVYTGAFSTRLLPHGYGTWRGNKGERYWGQWTDGERGGFGCAVTQSGKVKVGEWRSGKYRGERMLHTSSRIYGIDLSRYQHEQGRKRYRIDWDRLRITALGSAVRRKASGTVDYRVSFVYIKSTEGKTVRNRYYAGDRQQARRRGIPVGAYHFFSTTSSGAQQARFFLRHTRIAKGDLPPVLDVEPTDRQISKMGGSAALFRHMRAWLSAVRQQTGARPILYVSQRFVNKYLPLAPDLKNNYQVWIARYGEYRPDVRLAFWQLSPEGRVSGIHGDVDINVFNGSSDSFNEFLKTETVR